jgi:hypothetical protein
MNTQLQKTLLSCLKKEDGSNVARAAFYTAHIAPLMGPKGIDWKAGQAKVVYGMIYATVSKWYASESRVVDGVEYSKAEIAKAIDKKGIGHAARDGALSGIRMKVRRWTESIVREYGPKAAPTGDSKAPSGKVSLGQKRSAARKGKAATAKPADMPASVPMLSEALRDGIAKLKPQSRIVAANLVMDYMRNIISEARAAMDTAPRKPAKASKAAKAVAPAPAAVQ